MNDFPKRLADFVQLISDQRRTKASSRWFVSTAELAEAFGCDEGSVITAARKAEDRGLVKLIVARDNVNSPLDPLIAVEAVQ